MRTSKNIYYTKYKLRVRETSHFYSFRYFKMRKPNLQFLKKAPTAGCFLLLFETLGNTVSEFNLFISSCLHGRVEMYLKNDAELKERLVISWSFSHNAFIEFWVLVFISVSNLPWTEVANGVQVFEIIFQIRKVCLGLLNWSRKITWLMGYVVKGQVIQVPSAIVTSAKTVMATMLV